MTANSKTADQQLLQNILETSPIGIVVTNTVGQITFANQEAEKILGLEKESITQLTYNDPAWLITDFDSKPFPDEQLPFSVIKKTLKSAYNIQHAIQWPDGKQTLLRINAAPQLDDSGNFIGMVAAIEDVTEKVKSEKALKHEMERASHYLRMAGTMIIVFDKNQLVTLANPKTCEILGYSEHEIVGKNWFDHFLPKENKDAVKKVYDKIIAGRLSPVEFYENPVVNSSGEERLIAWHNSILKDDDGKIIGLLSSGEDVTQHHESQKQLLEQFQFLQTLINTIPSPVFYKDSEGKYTGCNKGFQQIYRIPPGKDPGKNSL